ITSCPGNISVHAAAGSCNSAPVTYSGSATDNCGGTPVIAFSPPSGSTVPPGAATVTMTAADAGGDQAPCQVTVTHDRQNELVVDVELGGGIMDAGSYMRCITFELWNGGVLAQTISQTFTFTGGNMPATTLLVPCNAGPYSCITARDRLHTLRRTINPLPIVGTQYSANFTGAKLLIGGNFNDDGQIDVLDFGIYTIQDLTVVGKNTNCTQVPPFRHADANGDGIVDSIDFGFVSTNFLQLRETNCNGAALVADGSDGGPVTRISVDELQRRGMADLIPADLNRDGWLDLDDITAYL